LATILAIHQMRFDRLALSLAAHMLYVNRQQFRFWTFRLHPITSFGRDWQAGCAMAITTRKPNGLPLRLQYI
jgi:hypothetical protein